MAQNSGSGSPALDREAGRVDRLMKDSESKEASKESKASQNGLNNPIQVEQDNRVQKAQADAKAAGGGPAKPEDGLNQDG